MAALFYVLFLSRLHATGIWTQMPTPAPNGGGIGMLLSDGSVLVMNNGAVCYRLTPDNHGNYLNGTWTQLASMNSARWNFSTAVLTNGNVYVAGGEYGDANHYDAEVYDTIANTWTVVPGSASPNSQAPYINYSDSVSVVLPSGNLMQSDAQSHYFFYNPVSNAMTDGGPCDDMNEASWCILSNGCVFTVANYGAKAVHYIPASNQWITDTTSTPQGAQYGDNQSILLPDGTVFIVGASTNTAIYTQGATPTSAGSLVNGTLLPMYGTNVLRGDESGCIMLPNGNCMVQLYPFNGGATYYYEYNYLSKTFTLVTDHLGVVDGGYMLPLPDGTILNSHNSYIYTPDGAPLAAWRSVINTVTENQDGTYTLTGTGLSGISQGTPCNDDGQPCSNYPIVRMTNGVTGNVYFGRTYGWTGGLVQTGNRVLTTQFSLPQNLPTGAYSLSVVANGIASTPITYTYSPLAVPTGLAAVIANTQLVLSWNTVPGATSYAVYRSAQSGTGYKIIGSVTGTNFTDTSLFNGVGYYYVVTAVGSDGPSAYSAELYAAPNGPPATPTGLAAVADGYNRVDLSWTGVAGAASYNVKRSTTSGSGYTTIGITANTTFTDTDSNLVSGATYYYVVSAVSAGGESANSLQVSALNSLPAPWMTADIGTAGFTGSASYSGGVYTIKGSGNDIWVSPDQFRFLYFTITNNGAVGAGSQLTVRAVTLQNTFTAAKAGLMFRDSLSPNAAFAMADVTAGSGLEFITRTGGGSPVLSGSAAGGVIKWLQITRTNNTFTAAYSANGTTWTALGGAVTIPLGGVCYAGMIVCSHNNNALCTATLDNFSYTDNAVAWTPPPPTSLTASGGLNQVSLAWSASTGATSYNVKRATSNGGPYTMVASLFAITNSQFAYTDTVLSAGTNYYYVVTAANGTNESANSAQVSATAGGPLPAPWQSVDIGSPGVAGSASFANGMFSTTGSGADIWNNSDSFRYVYQAIYGDCDLRARVASAVQPTSAGAKAGVMIRETLTGSSKQALMCLQTGGTPQFLERTATSGSTTQVGTGVGSAPYWVRLTRTNNTFTAYNSVNGITWVQVGTPQSINMNSAVFAGLAICSHDNSTVCTATFDNVAAQWNSAPANLTGTAGVNSAQLGWNSVTGVSSYLIKRSTMDGGPYAMLASTTATNFTDTSVTNGMTYYYVVSSAGPTGEIAQSGQVAVNPLVPPPVVLQAGLQGGHQFVLSFQGQASQNYVVESSTNLANWTPVLTNSTSSGQIFYTNTSPTDAALFYRVYPQ